MPSNFKSLSRQQVFALAVNDAKESVSVPLSVVRAEGRACHGFSSNFDPQAQEACFHALWALEFLGIRKEKESVYFFAPGFIRKVSGPSLGLAAVIALLRHQGIMDEEEPIWATGEVTPFGSVLPVGGMQIKLTNTAIEGGRVIIPKGYQAPPGIRVAAIDHIKEALEWQKIPS